MTSSNQRVFALGAIIAGQFALALSAVQAVISLIGLQELPVVVPLVVGMLWGQAILLGQFVVLARRWPLVRVLLAASWFAAVIHLGEPFFRATGGHDAFVAGCVILAMPFVFTVLLMAARRGGGLRITLYHSDLNAHDREAIRFSLRHLFLLTSLAAIALAGMRLARDTVAETWQALFFGFLPVIGVFVLLPMLSLWAALGDKRPALRAAALVLFSMASVLAPLFIGRAEPRIYWMLVWPTVLPSLVVIGSLLIVRAVGYRYVVEWLLPYRARPIRHRRESRREVRPGGTW